MNCPRCNHPFYPTQSNERWCTCPPIEIRDLLAKKLLALRAAIEEFETREPHGGNSTANTCTHNVSLQSRCYDCSPSLLGRG